MNKNILNYFFFLLIIGFCVFTDQLSKIIILQNFEENGYFSNKIFLFLKFTFVKNYGVTFGLFAENMLLRDVLSFIIIFVIIYLFYCLYKSETLISKIAFSIIIGGAFGNLYDRFFLGYVVDFIDITALYFPWVFNMADIYINIGVILLLFENLCCMMKEKNKRS